MLIRHALDELSKEIVPPKIFLPLNMQELTFLDVKSFIERLSKNLSAWFEEVLSSCRIKSRYFQVDWKSGPPNLIKLLRAMSKDWHGCKGIKCQHPYYSSVRQTSFEN